MSDTCLPPMQPEPELGAQWRPVADVLDELAGSRISARTAATWAAAGLPTARGRRGTLLTTRSALLRFLRERGPSLRTSA